MGCSELGMLPRAAGRAALPLHHPGRSGGPGWLGRDAGGGLASPCSSFAPLFVNVLKCICRGGFTPWWCQAVRAAPEPGCSACCVGANLAKHRTPNAFGSPPGPPPSHLACKLPSTSPQPRLPSQGPAASPQAPSSRCLSCLPPAHPLPPPQSLRAQKSQETSGKSRSQTPRCHQLPGGCLSPRPPHRTCSPPAPHSRPDAEGMDVHVLGPGVCSPPRSCTL